MLCGNPTPQARCNDIALTLARSLLHHHPPDRRPSRLIPSSLVVGIISLARKKLVVDVYAVALLVS